MDRTEYTASKQDLNGTRTAQNIEQKYNLGAINSLIKMLKDNEQVLAELGLDMSSLESELDETQSALQTTNEDLAQAKTDITNTRNSLNTFANATTATLQTMQSEIDGSITTFFHADAPTMNNYPASGWQQTEYSKHLGDLYYDTDTGYAYRFYVENNVYGWMRITDEDIAEALSIAQAAQDTADGKRRVFLNLGSESPTPPYDAGDLWITDDGQLFVCQLTRESGDYYHDDDFIASLDYTDDTYARKVEEDLYYHLELINGQFTEFIQKDDQIILNINSSIQGVQNAVATQQETMRQMSYNFGENYVKICDSESPNYSTLDNKGLLLYNFSNLMSVFNKNGSGVNKLIIVNSAQLQNLMIKKRQITIPGDNTPTDVISGFWLTNLIQSLDDLVED